MLDGAYSLVGNDTGAVSLTSEAGRTKVTAKCRHGQPVEFILGK